MPCSSLKHLPDCQRAVRRDQENTWGCEADSAAEHHWVLESALSYAIRWRAGAGGQLGGTLAECVLQIPDTHEPHRGISKTSSSGASSSVSSQRSRSSSRRVSQQR